MTHTWLPTGPALVRGTVVVLPGRGEHGGVYERLGRRLAYDAYAVHVFDVAPDTPADDVRDLVLGLADSVARPLILAGSDTGALHALRLALSGYVPLAGLLLSGIPAAGAEDIGWERELEVRTACPTHRARLADDPDFARGALSGPVPAELLAVLADPALPAFPVPALILHGADDPIAPAAVAFDLADRLPAAELAIARTSAHDVLNDAIHRTVAAHVVQWLERLREGRLGSPLLAVRPARYSEPARPAEPAELPALGEPAEPAQLPALAEPAREPAAVA